MASDSVVAIECRPENVPLPTDSMITVRLSDPQSESATSTHETSPDNIECEFPLQPCSEDVQPQSPRESIGSVSSTSSNSTGSSQLSSMLNSVDWEGLEKSEEQAPRDEGTDESTALLLARLEQENNAIAKDPKFGVTAGRQRSDARPPSIHQLKKLVNGPQRQSLRYSLLPAPQMTELEFWAALVQDYPQTLQRLPTLTSNKIRSGVPPPLRGVVWASIAGAHDRQLHEHFERLSTQPSPYDGLIGLDSGRSFPNVEMFRDADGEGQQMLRRVLKVFSLYDDKIGYCQGLGFVVGPLLMHMGEADAFCVLVRLMERYDLRTCYTPDLAGLHLRIYQFQTLLSRHLPELAQHLQSLGVEPLYVSQWFLSFFAVTCPLPMLLRIYDIILAEGAPETLMRVALALMQRNQKKLMAFTEFEEIMQFLLSRSLWDNYAQQADQMVTDFVALTNLVSRESLQNLEADFAQSQTPSAPSPLKTAAAAMLGRFWAGSTHSSSKSGNLSLMIPGGSHLRKTSSGQSLTSTVISVETIVSEHSTAPTETSENPRIKSEIGSLLSTEVATSSNSTSADRDFHHQIEELLTAMSKLQHQQVELARDLQREREEREEERAITSSLLSHLQKQRAEIKELLGEEESCAEDIELDDLIAKATHQLSSRESRRVSIIQTKHQLRDSVAEWKEKYDAEAARCLDLMRRLDEREIEHNLLKESLKDARQRVQDSHRDKQRLERNVQDLRTRFSSGSDSPQDLYTPVSEKDVELRLPPPKGGLREFRLGKTEQSRTPTSNPSAKRTSSLNSQATTSLGNDSLLLELVNAKTSEAQAKQELEETKAKLDSLRKIISGSSTSPGSRIVNGADPINSPVSALLKTPDAPRTVSHASTSSVGGFFSGWGKRGT